MGTKKKLTGTIKASEANISTSELKEAPDKAWFEDNEPNTQSPEDELIQYVKLTRLKLDSQMQLIDVCLGTGSGAAKKHF